LSQADRAAQHIPYLTTPEGEMLTGSGSTDQLTGAIKNSWGCGREGKA